MATSNEITDGRPRSRCTRRSSTCRRSSAASAPAGPRPALVEKLRVDYYGSEVPLQQLAGFSVPEPRVLVVAPYDKGAMKAIEKAIQASDLGVNPSNDGAVIRLDVPAAHRGAAQGAREGREEPGRGRPGRGAQRAPGCRKELEAIEKDGEISQDELDRIEKDLEKLTHEVIAEIDEMVAHKEQELLEV